MLVQSHPRRAPVATLAGDVITFGPMRFRGARMRFSRNEEIFGESEPAQYIYRVISGTVRTIHFTGEGRRQIVAFSLPGDIFGLELGEAHSFTAEAVAEAEVVLVRRGVIETAAGEDIAVARALLQHTSSQLQEALAHALMLGRKGAGERVAAFLLWLSERAAVHREIDLPMSRADIADHLALTIETVSRAFTQMERDEYIALPSSRRIVVRDRTALECLQAA